MNFNPLVINERLQLRPVEEEDAPELFKLTIKNKEYLKEWLPWLDSIKVEADTLEFIIKNLAQRNIDKVPAYLIIYNNLIVGTIGFQPLKHSNNSGEIGYWLSQEYNGLGIMNLVCQTLISFGFSNLNLNRIQILAAEKNIKSRSIPERLDFKFEGIIRDNEKLNGNYLNHAMYSMLRQECQAESFNSILKKNDKCAKFGF